MVTLASAMLVAKMIFRVSRGGGSKIKACSSGGKVEYRGKGRIFGAAFGNLANKSFPLNRIQALNSPLYSISDLLQGLIDLFPSCQEHKDISSGLL